MALAHSLFLLLGKDWVEAGWFVCCTLPLNEMILTCRLHLQDIFFPCEFESFPDVITHGVDFFLKTKKTAISSIKFKFKLSRKRSTLGNHLKDLKTIENESIAMSFAHNVMNTSAARERRMFILKINFFYGRGWSVSEMSSWVNTSIEFFNSYIAPTLPSYIYEILF